MDKNAVIQASSINCDNYQYVFAFIHAGCWIRPVFVFSICLVLLINLSWADTFGSVGTVDNQFAIDFVMINGKYRIGKFEITRCQWVKYQSIIGINSSNQGLDDPDLPVEVDWDGAAHFVNWLNTSTGHHAAYKLVEDQGTGDSSFSAWEPDDFGYDPSNPYRNKHAHYYLPTEDEWVNAAYWNGTDMQVYATKAGEHLHQGNGVNGTGWNYFYEYSWGPTNPCYGRPATSPPGPWRVGSGSEELNGTYDMMGNLWELTETPCSAENNARVIRGGAYECSIYIDCRRFLESTFRTCTDNLYYGYSEIGFRVASNLESEMPIKYSGGYGYEDYPYEIATTEDLIALGQNTVDYDKYFILTADIDLSSYQDINNSLIAPSTQGSNWQFNGLMFDGNFDGAEHTISNLHINASGSNISYLGLFGYIGSSAQIVNIKIQDCTIIGGPESNCIGGLCGFNNGTIEQCHISCLIEIGNLAQYVGGLCGENHGTIRDCDTISTVISDYDEESGPLGGLCGANRGVINGCYANGTVMGIYAIGGLCGTNMEQGIITNSDASGNIMGKSSVGGLCGENSAVISQCHATTHVSVIDLDYEEGGDSLYEFIGGLCGWNYLGIISECYAAGIVWSRCHTSGIGGFCGWSNGTIENSYSLASVTSGEWSEYIGGFCGEKDNGTIDNCYASSPISVGQFSEKVGGLCGYSSGIAITSCFWDIETSSTTTSDGGFGKTTAEMQDVQSYLNSGWDFIGESINGTDDYWMIRPGEYPRLVYFEDLKKGSGTKDDPFKIYSIDDFLYAASRNEDYDKYYILMNDINLLLNSNNTAFFAPDTSTSSGFQGASFTGSFDGQGYSIIGLTIEGVDEGNDYLGLFGFVGTGGIVKNLHLVDCLVAGDDYISGLSGMNYGSVENCSVQGSLSGDDYIGGITSYKLYGTVSKCWTDINIITGDFVYYVGGLVGQAYSSTITGCSAQVDIICQMQADWIGGLIGGTTNGQIMQSCSIGTIETNDMCDNLGGLMGINYGGIIKESYSTVDISSVGDCWLLGGLVGNNTYNTANHRLSGIINCYATGNISGRELVGGLVGSNEFGCQITSSYATGAVNGKSSGGLVGFNFAGDVEACVSGIFRVRAWFTVEPESVC